MKMYAQFLQLDTEGNVQEACGSEGVFILDGRNALRTQKTDAMVRMHKLRVVHPNYIGYRIMKGEKFSNSKMICEWIRSGARK